MSDWPEGWSREPRRARPPEDRGPVYDDEATRVIPRSSSREPSHGAPPPPPALPAQGRPRRRGRRGRRVLIAVLVIVALLLGLMFYFYSKIEKVDALQDYEGRPEKTPGQDYLLVGSDSREGLTAAEAKKLRLGKTAGRRTDTVILLHVPEGGGRSTMVSLPRDSYVPIPGRGRNKLNAAYAFGGAPLLVKTVETVTGIRIDHYTEIGFGGFVGMVDAVGGVELCPKRNMKDRRSGLNVEKGCQEMDGPKALAYVRARYSDPKGDLGRVERQQEFLGAVFEKAGSAGTLFNPFKILSLGNAATTALRVDERDGPFDLVRFAFAMRAVAGGDARKITVPVADPNLSTESGSAVQWDRDEALKLFRSLRER